MSGHKNLPAFGFLEVLDARVEDALFSSERGDFSTSTFAGSLKEKLFFAHWHFVRNDWNSSFKILNGIFSERCRESKDPLQQSDLCEALFLKELVSDRLGISLLEKKYFDEIYPLLKRLGRLDIHFAFQTEAAGQMMARGFYKAAFAHLSAAAAMPCSKPWFWRFRASIISGICSQAIGQFAQSEKELFAQEQFLERHVTGSLYLALQRRKLSFLIESECYDAVERHIEQNEKRMFLCDDNSVKAMWLKDIARYRSTVLGPDSAFGFWEEFEETLRQAGLSDDFLRPTEERCEVAILQNNLDEAREIIESALSETLKIGIPSAECVCLFAKARILCHLREFDLASETALAALRIAQVYDYRREQVRILFVLHALAKNQSDERKAQALFSEVCSHNVLKNLQFHSDFVCHIRALFERGQEVITAYLKMKNRSTLSKSVFAHWTVSYGYSILPHQRYKLVTFSESSLKSYSEFSALPHLVERVCSRYSVCYFVGEGCLVDARKSDNPKAISLQLEKRAISLLHALLKSGKKGLRLPEVHALSWPNVAWRQERHAPACYQLISECRAVCKEMGLILKLDEKRRTYYIRASDNPVVLAFPFFTRARSGKNLKNDRREQQILNELHSRKMASGSSLAAFLKITRQTLHPLLKKMVQEGKITLIGAGRGAHYICADHRSSPR